MVFSIFLNQHAFLERKLRVLEVTGTCLVWFGCGESEKGVEKDM